MTTCAPAAGSFRSTTPRIFERIASTSPWAILPRSTRFASGSLIRRKPPSTRRCSMSRIVTGNPAAAHAWAIPAPIVPAPITAIFRTSAACMPPPFRAGNRTANVKPAFIRDCGRLISPPPYGRGRGAPMQRPPRSLVLALAIVLTLASIVAVTPRAAAAQNRPSWTQGDFWVYARTAGSETSTIRLEVIESTTLTLTSGTYSVWHVTSTTTDANGNVTVQLVDISFSFPLAYSATVIAERSTTVAAGSFNVAVIRSPSTGTAHDENSYSEGAGNSVKQESFDGNGNRVAEQELTAYRYQSGLVGLLLIIGGVVVLAAIAIAVLAVMRRRKMARPPGAYPPPPPQAPPPSP